MKILKLGHCCLLIEESGQKLLTDPGLFTVQAHSKLTGLTAILFTHEHQDHLHMDSLKELMRINPNARIITNSGVGRLLSAENIAFELLEHGQNMSMGSVLVEGFGQWHGDIYPSALFQPFYIQQNPQLQKLLAEYTGIHKGEFSVPVVANTGFLIAEKFYYPGDALFLPQKPVEVLALPVAGPWLKLSEAIDFAKAVNPKKCFPVHDGILSFTLPFHLQPQKALAELGIEVLLPDLGSPMNF